MNPRGPVATVCSAEASPLVSGTHQDADAAAIDLATEDGFARFVLECQERVYRFLLRRGVPSLEAQDLRQEAFLVLWRSRGKPRNPRTFLLGVANRLAMAYHRQQLQLPTASIEEMDPALFASNDREAAAAGPQRISPAIAAAIGRLTRRQREVIELVWLQNLSRTEAAQRLGITAGALRYHEKVAFDRLRALPADELPKPNTCDTIVR